VKSDPHLVQASRYIHRNPVEAALWPSRGNGRGRARRLTLALRERRRGCTPEAILGMLGPQNARQRYRELLGEEVGVATQAVDGEVAPSVQTRRV
jgi:hypothetical protein